MFVESNKIIVCLEGNSTWLQTVNNIYILTIYWNFSI